MTRERSVYCFSGSGFASATAVAHGHEVRLITGGQEMSVVHNITPEAARALAAELLNAADAAVASKSGTDGRDAAKGNGHGPYV